MSRTKKYTAAGKLEKVMVFALATLQGKDKPLKDVPIFAGRKDVDEFDENLVLPCVDVLASRCHIVAELDDEWEATLDIIIRIQAGDGDGTDIDDRANAILDLVSDIDALKLLVNPTNPKRPIPQFFLQDIYQTEENSDNVDRTFKEVLTFLVKFRDDDGQGT